MAVSLPPYPVQHDGAVLVCGSAFSLPDDYSNARVLFPDAPCIAVKDAAYHIKAFAIFGLHPAKMPRMVEGQSLIHNDFTTHMGPPHADRGNLGEGHSFNPDYLWPEAEGGSSGWAACKMAKMMGFSIIVMCGIPMVKGGYVGGKLSQSFQRDSIIEVYQNRIIQDAEYHDSVFSMSGWTRELLGAP